MKSLLLVALAGATFASEIALDTPEQFIKEQKDAKYSHLVPSEDLRETLNKPAGEFSLSASPDADADADAWYGYYGISRPSRPLGGYAGYRPYYGYYGKRSAEPDAEADPLHYYQKREAPAAVPLTPGNIPGLVPGSVAAAEWWTAQLQHQGQIGISRPSIPAGGYAGYRPYYGKRSAEPDAEADPLHYYAPYSYPYFYRPYAASGYAGPLPGASYQSVPRLHKREAQNFGTTGQPIQQSGASASLPVIPEPGPFSIWSTAQQGQVKAWTWPGLTVKNFSLGEN